MTRRQAKREMIFNESEKGKEKRRGRKKIKRVWGGLALELSICIGIGITGTQLRIDSRIHFFNRPNSRTMSNQTMSIERIDTE